MPTDRGRRFSILLDAIFITTLIIPFSHSQKCSANEFHCLAGQCVPFDYKCDGEGDCPDSSDEEDCDAGDCQSNEFPCDNGKCIPYVYRCDKDNDCGDNSDEKCDPFLDHFLIVSDTGRNKDLYQINLGTNVMLPLKVGTSKLNGLAFDGTRKVVYWTDIDESSIKRYPLQGSDRTIETIHTHSSGGVLEGLSLDVVNRKLYYCASNVSDKTNGRIGEMSLDGSGHRVIVSEPGQPRAIVVDANNGVLYWTDWGSNPAIIRARISDGKERTVLVNREIKWPNALAIDFEENIIYWGDAWYYRIYKMNLDGTGRTVVLDESSSNASYFSISLSSHFIYITDRKQSSVRKLNRQTLEISNQHPENLFNRLNGIVYFHSNFTNAEKKVSSSTLTDFVQSTRQTETDIHGKRVQVPDHEQKADTNDNIPQPVLLQDSVKSSPAISDTAMIIIIVVVVVGVVVTTTVITIGVVVVKQRNRNRLLLEKRAIAENGPRGLNSYNYSLFVGGVSSSTTSFASEDGELYPRPGMFRCGRPSHADDDAALPMYNIYSTVVGDYENLNTYESIDDTLI